MNTELDDIAETMESYLSDRLVEGPVSVSDVTHHTAGWSRRTLSFNVSWSAEGVERSQRLVARVGGNTSEKSDHEVRNDVEGEFEVMAAVADTDVPVPGTHWYESDESVLGDPFFLVEYRPGEAPITWNRSDRQQLYDAWDSGARSLPHQFVDAAAEIHSLTADDVPFLDRATPEEFVETELDTYVSVYEATKLEEEPAVNEAIRWFRENKPAVTETTLIHGDFRIGNVLIEDDDVRAVLDWEFARLGDPMYDLGYASTRYFAGKLIDPIERPELACSLLEREWFYEEYEKRTGRTVDRDRVRYWRAFAAFTMMTRGIASVHRFETGQTDDMRSAWLQYIVPGHIEDLLAIVREDRTLREDSAEEWTA